MSEVGEGDVVAIRGDLMLTAINGPYKGRCKYTPDQLVDGKYLKHTGHGGVWTGVVSKIRDTPYEYKEVRCGGGWWASDLLEVLFKHGEIPK